MNWQLWAAFAVTETALCLKPGPAVLLVLSQGVTRGAIASLWSSAGILSGNALYFALSATGLGVILATSYKLFFVVKLIGAAYLIWLGARTFFGRSAAFSVTGGEQQPASGRRMFANGFVLQASNPGGLIFFTMILPQFIDQNRPLLTQVAILGATSVAIEFVVLACYGYLAGRVTRLAAKPRFARLTNCAAGTMLIAAGAGIATIRQGR